MGDPYIKKGVGKREHVRVVERILGKELPKRVEVHHVNEKKRDNRPENLVVCPDRAYHMLLHYRMRALYACGHAGWLKCEYCKKYDDPSNLRLRKGKWTPKARHAACHALAVAKGRMKNAKPDTLELGVSRHDSDLFMGG